MWKAGLVRRQRTRLERYTDPNRDQPPGGTVLQRRRLKCSWRRVNATRRLVEHDEHTPADQFVLGPLRSALDAPVCRVRVQEHQ